MPKKLSEDKQKILDALKTDLTNAQSFHDEWQEKRAVWIKEWNGEPYGNEPKDPKSNKARLVSRDIKQSGVWQQAQVIDPFVSTPDMIRAVPITAEDEELSDEQELILNQQYCRDFDRYNFTKDSFNVLQREGTVHAKVSWIFKEEEQDVEVPIVKMLPVQDQQKAQAMLAQGIPPYEQVQVGTKIEKQMVTIENKPDVEVINNAFIYVDPTVEGKAEKGQFQIIKFPSNISKLKEAGIYKNLDEVDAFIQKELDKSDSNYDGDNGDFKFTDKARREFEVVEYWGNYDVDGDGIAEPIVWAWVGGILIREDENPFPDKQTPFVSCVVDPDPFSPCGKPNADLLSVNQKIMTGLKRTVLNTLNASTNGQKGVKKQSLDPINLQLFKNGKDFEYNTDDPQIWTGDFNQIPQSIFAFGDSIERSNESLTGIRPFNSGSGSMGSATEARGALDAVAKREVDISRNFKENFILPILKKWMSMNNSFLEDEQITRITNKPPVPKRPGFETIDLDIKIETAETKSARSRELSFMLQTMSASLPFDLTKILLAEQAEMSNMPGLSKKIEEFQQQPDPLDQQIKQLEIEKLKAEIEEKRSRAIENQADLKLKQAKTQTEMAKARETHGKADSNDLDYVRKADGSAHREDMEKQGQKIKGDIVKQSMSNKATTSQ